MHNAQSDLIIETKRHDGMAAEPVATSSEDRFRAEFYRLLAHFLSAPPSAEGLTFAAGLEGDAATPLGEAVNAVAAAARASSPAAEAEAYQSLFIGLGRGILVPFGSYYLTGFLHEKPLARLRADMDRLGFARADDVSEPEDHIASVLELMAALIEGRDRRPPDLAEQRQVFEDHVASWAGHFFRDLKADPTSAFYAALGGLGERFIEIESRAFRLG